MTYEELRDAINGIYAFDEGAVDSGIRDQGLRQRVKEHVARMSPVHRRSVLSTIMRDSCLSDEAIAQGYGWEDAGELARWFDEQFGVG